MRAILLLANYRHMGNYKYSPISLNIDCTVLTQYLNKIKANINHMAENFIKPGMKANRQYSPTQDPICPRQFEF